MKKIVIIGAGPAGLTAAKELTKATADYSITVLEMSNDIGGISRTVEYNGNRMDMGGHRFFSKDDKVMNWWREILPVQGKPSYDDKLLGRETRLEKGGPDPELTEKVMLFRNRISRIYYKNKFFDYPITMKPQTFINMGLASTIKAGISYIYACCVKRDENSLENFYVNRFGKVLYSMFFEGYTEKVWGRHPKDISADWGSQRVKGLSIPAVVRDMFHKAFGGKKSKNVETSLIEEFWYPKLGPGQLWEAVAEDVENKGVEIRKSCTVTGIHKSDNKIDYLIVDTPQGEEKIETDYVISSMPLKDLVQGMNEVPADISRIACGLPYRDFVTVGLLLDRLKIKNKTKIKTMNNIVPDCWIYVQDTGVRLGRIQIFNNWSPYMVKDPEHKIWIGLEYFCTEGDAFWNMSESECVDMAVNELKEMGVIDEDAKISDSHREKVKKAYPAYFDTYSEIDKLIKYLNEIDNLFCVGRNGQHRYNNMDHSMVTSFEAVNNILNGIHDKSNIWNVNTEKEYHERK